MACFNFPDDFLPYFSELVQIRRTLHSNPELEFDLPFTTGYISEYLNSLGLEVHVNVGKSGVVGILRGLQPEPCILLRADIDALPIEEANEFEYKSKFAGKMHACGHDGHAAILMVAAKILSSIKHTLHGTVKFVFQPAEEIFAGALALLNDENFKVLTDEGKVSETYAMHIMTDDPLGSYIVNPGSISAYSDTFEIEILGKGGHAAAPQGSKDPVICAASLIVAFQSIVSRNIGPFETSVISVGKINAGTSPTIVPEKVSLEGIVRAFKSETRETCERRMREICAGHASSYVCKIELNYKQGIPAIYNDPGPTSFASSILASMLGDNNLNRRSTGADDWAYVMQRVPSCYIALGCKLLDKDRFHHTASFDFDERVMINGIGLWVNLVVARLK
jgi:amidohydrolase